MKLASRHLLGLDGMSREEIALILDTAVSFREILDRPIGHVRSLLGYPKHDRTARPSGARGLSAVPGHAAPAGKYVNSVTQCRREKSRELAR